MSNGRMERSNISETTVAPGFGTAGGFVKQVLQVFPAATSEAIVYPACGGQSSCGSNWANKIQNYCDSVDPYCCTGNDANAHQQHVNKYGSQAMTFIRARLNQSTAPTNPSNTTTTANPQPPVTTTAAPSNPGGGSCAPK
ncbi:hypothetical protein QBC38DRAFT_503454 [Podospora fimiseda]|uniref:Uncharacterized protein n=1 Tax=Podospora fimiseda TaxID=252190 RepID=A0AAN7BGU6_9PEZI|nr:hypothetical protein QBC38DRAFT_503454 [Podospora fimiseda]